MTSVDTNVQVKNILIINVKNIFEPEVNFIIQKTNELEETYAFDIISCRKL